MRRSSVTKDTLWTFVEILFYFCKLGDFLLVRRTKTFFKLKNHLVDFLTVFIRVFQLIKPLYRYLPVSTAESDKEGYLLKGKLTELMLKEVLFYHCSGLQL